MREENTHTYTHLGIAGTPRNTPRERPKGALLDNSKATLLPSTVA
jgi:hypothetical protein